eukprot:gene26618-4242_t
MVMRTGPPVGRRSIAWGWLPPAMGRRKCMPQGGVAIAGVRVNFREMMRAFPSPLSAFDWSYRPIPLGAVRVPGRTAFAPPVSFSRLPLWVRAPPPGFSTTASRTCSLSVLWLWFGIMISHLLHRHYKSYPVRPQVGLSLAHERYSLLFPFLPPDGA